MGKREAYRERLRSLRSWRAFLLAESGLPGPRTNLELAFAVADEGTLSQFQEWLEETADRAPTNSPREFLAFCGTIGLGEQIARGRHDLLAQLRRLAADSRWRVREATAIALQRVGATDMALLLREMRRWIRGTLLERRAAAAALCEPPLLREPAAAHEVLGLLDRIMVSVITEPDRRSEEFRVLRQALGYCWSVAVVAAPEEGKRRMERWLANEDPDVVWIMRENLKKERLRRLDPDWVAAAER